ncbi:MAG: hypothetical protein CSB33_04675 [Desulfobacterales bacterium]|nr:MAG: hypothetical protein CSB33_04675 [Desulfobacterales bacterium]
MTSSKKDYDGNGTGSGNNDTHRGVHSDIRHGKRWLIAFFALSLLSCWTSAACADRLEERRNIRRENRTERRNIRRENRAERQNLRRENRAERQNIKQENREEWQNLRQENRAERQNLRRENRAERQNLRRENRAERQNLRRENRAERQNLRQENREEWQNLRQENRAERQNIRRENRTEWRNIRRENRTEWRNIRRENRAERQNIKQENRKERWNHRREHANRRQEHRHERYHRRHGHHHGPPRYAPAVSPLGLPLLPVLPPGAIPLKVGHIRFHFHGGLFYRHDTRGYIAVTPPVGAIFVRLPLGFTKVWIDGAPYYRCRDSWVRKARSGYVVVASPYAVSVPDFRYEVRVTARLLNVRSGPDRSHRILAQVCRGDILEVRERSGGWLFVRLPSGGEGWVMDRYTDSDAHLSGSG